MNIVVLTGGISQERDVCLASGSAVADALLKKGHKIFVLDVYLGFESNKIDESIFSNSNNLKVEGVPILPPSIEEIKKIRNNSKEIIGPNVIEICKMADVVFLALHGTLGEDGKIQGLLELYGIKYTGSKMLESALCLDKHVTKIMLQYYNIPVAPWKTYEVNEINKSEIIKEIGIPCVVKPIDSGSSIGISIVESEGELDKAIEDARMYSKLIMFEKKIVGREIQVGVLDGKALPTIEIITPNGFFDYANKYQVGFSKEITPAQISDYETKLVQEYSEKIYKVLNISDYVRIDFIMTSNSEFICLEVNTLPGMTNTSLLPQEAKAEGISYEDLCEKIAIMGSRK